jgi:hypothetical protein
MSTAALTWFVLGACLAYVVVQDANVYEWLVLQSRMLGVWFQRQWFLVRHNPDSPWVRYETKRNAEANAQKLLDELNADK